MVGFTPSHLVARTQLVDSQDLSGAESLPEQVNRTHLSAEHAVGVRRLGRSQETLVKRLQGTSETRKWEMDNSFNQLHIANKACLPLTTVNNTNAQGSQQEEAKPQLSC